jgi:hypothetical protein
MKVMPAIHTHYQLGFTDKDSFECEASFPQSTFTTTIHRQIRCCQLAEISVTKRKSDNTKNFRNTKSYANWHEDEYKA